MSGTLGGNIGSRLSRGFDDASRGLDRFGLVLALTVASVVELALVDLLDEAAGWHQQVASLVAALLTGITLMAALRASGVAQRRVKLLDILILLTLLGYVGTILFEAINGPLPGPVSGLSTVIVALSVFAPGIVVLRLLRHRTVTSATMLGAISAYLLIGLAFYWLFLATDAWQPHYFTQGAVPSTSYMYFSLTSLTTVGYGDLTAATPFGRLLANTEAVVGQVYLVTFVALIVGLRVAEWQRDRDQREAAEAAESGDDGR